MSIGDKLAPPGLRIAHESLGDGECNDTVTPRVVERIMCFVPPPKNLAMLLNAAQIAVYGDLTHAERVRNVRLGHTIVAEFVDARDRLRRDRVRHARYSQCLRGNIVGFSEP